MYSPTTRLLTVLELLQSYKHISGTEIARRLEVDKRTVRRYIVMLQDMGIPVEAERGVYGTYQLRRGYKVPPLMFTDAEAIAITLSLLAIREYQFPIDVTAVEGALAKTERVMPEKLLRQVRALQEAIVFNFSTPSTQLQGNLLTTLSTAVQQNQQVYLRYQSWDGSESERAFNPYGIVFNDGYWYTAGYCHLRQDLRTFRLDRITTLEPFAATFERPTNFDTLDFVLQSVLMMSDTNLVEVILHTTIEDAQKAIPPFIGTIEATEGKVILRRSATQLDWITLFLLSLNFDVTIIQPIELHEKVRQIGMKALQMAAREP
jgi:predicted DNA-binding transcriptional regulator YafY